MKRVFDFLMALTALLILWPIILLVSLLVWCYLGKPIVFCQQRPGLFTRPFNIYKFRTMSLLYDSDGVLLPDEARMTSLGSFLRKSSLDELPQLWSVLLGHMSLVGPRPPVVREVEQYTLHDRKRLSVKPGLTCIWQVSGRAEIPFDKQVELDLQYIESQSLFTDVKLLFLTIPAVLFGKGAY